MTYVGSAYRTVTLDVSERIKVSLTYPGNSKIVLAMNEDGPHSALREEGAIVLELEPLPTKFRPQSPLASGTTEHALELKQPPAHWRTPGAYQRKRADDDAPLPLEGVLLNFPTLTSPTRTKTQT